MKNWIFWGREDRDWSPFRGASENILTPAKEDYDWVSLGFCNIEGRHQELTNDSVAITLTHKRDGEIMLTIHHYKDGWKTIGEINLIEHITLMNLAGEVK